MRVIFVWQAERHADGGPVAKLAFHGRRSTVQLSDPAHDG
jgi:hypothetical protein